jgi:uncharacterized membrane protein YdjX (TVP38/TMEM64 family)
MGGRLISARGAVVLGGVTILGLAFVALHAGDPLDDLLQLAEWIRVRGGWGWGILLILQILVCVFGVLPASLLVMVAGSLYGLWYGFLLASTATLLGGVGAFFAGRFLLGPFFRDWIGQHFPLMRVNEAIVAGSWRFTLLLRMSPVFPFALVSYGLGLSNIRLRDFVIGNLGILPSLFALTYTGAVADGVATMVVTDEGEQSLVQLSVLGLGLLATLIVVGVLTRVAYVVTRELMDVETEE